MSASQFARSGLAAAALSTLLCMSFPLTASAQSVTTTPVGAVTVTIRGNNSDTIVSIPLIGSQVEVSSSITSVAAGTGSSYILTTATSGWTADQFAGFHYVRMTSGAKEGMYYTITANSSSQLTVESIGDNLTQIQPGDTFKVYKHWTLNTLFPADQPNTASNPLTASSGALAFQRRSQILLPDISSTGFNLAPSTSYYFTSAGWFQSATGNPPANNVILYPDNYIIIRQPTAVAADINWTCTGAVSADKHALIAASNATTFQDNPVAIMRPHDVRLDLSGFDAGFVQSSNSLAFNRRDQLLVYDNPTRGLNLTPTRIFYRVAGQWIESVTGNPDANDYILPANAGVIIRKYKNPSETATISLNSLQVFNSETNEWSTPTF